MTQAAVFTLLPQDADADGGFRASVFVSPRLTPDGGENTAADFPAFADWPAVVSGATIVVEKRGAGSVELRAHADVLRSDLWRAYVSVLTVNGWQAPDLSGTEIRSFPAQSILALVEGLYRSVAAASRGDHPNPLAGGLRDLGAAHARLVGSPLESPLSRAEIDRRVDGRLASRANQRREEESGRTVPFEAGGLAPSVAPVSAAAALADVTNAILDLAEARRFYDRPEGRDPNIDPEYRRRPDPDFVPDEIENDDHDFHAALAALGDHPELLRALGIVIPLTLPADFVQTGGDFSVRLEHESVDPNPIVVQPWTRAAVDGRFFQPVSETGDLEQGMLLLDDSDRFDIAQVDVDSAAMLVEQRIANVYPIAQAANDGDPVTGDLPALRSTGLTVTRLRRSLILDQRIARSTHNAELIATGNELVLFAEDLVRGFRADVHDGAEWRSLMHRAVSYIDKASGAERLAVTDEAYLKASVLTSVPKAAVDRAYLHEALFGWDGWSLALPRPGRHIRGTDDDPGSLADEGEDFDGQLALRFRKTLVDGTLPRLRYGVSYRLRVRTVDLTGTSTGYASDDHATAAHSFRRFEPVSHPVVVPRHAFTEAESTLRLAIRSGVDADNSDASSPLTVVDPTNYAAALNAATPRRFARFRAQAERHLAPPKTSQREAELLSRFDDAIGAKDGPGRAAIYREAFARARREQGTFADMEILSATDPNSSTPVAGIQLAPPLAQDDDWTEVQLDAKLAALGRGEAPGAGFVIVHAGQTLRVPYLPDPLVAGIALRFSGHGTVSGWTHAELLTYSDTWPDLDTYRVVLASGPAPEVSVSGHEVTVELPPGATASVRASSTIDAATLDKLGMWSWIGSTVAAAELPEVLAGAHQMLTPGEELTLVHATQRPLVRPVFAEDLAAFRTYGQTLCRFSGTLALQSATTGRLDIDGSWSEWFDEPASGRPPELVAGRTGHAFNLAVVEDEDEVQLQSPTDATHEFGDTKHRKVSYTATATTRFREYLPPDVATVPEQLQVIGPQRTIHVPNSARPAAPVVHAVIPTFRWEELPEDPMDPRARLRSRSGGLRVWLDRPWYASGEDEMLGVVLSGADGLLRGTDVRRQHVSLWGKDPIRSSGDLAAPVPRPRDFAGEGLLRRDRLTLAETDATHPGVSVVGHPVTYSSQRDLWFADLEIEPGEAFWPFMRLALSRFQPWSVSTAELSQVVVADFVQLTNQRTATVTRPDAGTVRVTVTGITERRWAPPGRPGAPESGPVFHPIDTPTRGVRAWVERRGTLASDLDWQRVGDMVALGRVDEDEVMRAWSGDIELDIPIAAHRPGVDPSGEGSDWRLVLTEWEALLNDEPRGDGSAIERVVYLDRFPL